MDQDYHDASQECDAPAMVCLAHGRFIPCRKRGDHDISDDPADVAKVAYYQQMNEQGNPPRKPLVYREVHGVAEDWSYFLTEEYGSLLLMCGGRVFNHSNIKRHDHKFLVGCTVSFGADTPAALITEIRQHILVIPHYEAVPEG
jgi:hypothetical protein